MRTRVGLTGFAALLIFTSGGVGAAQQRLTQVPATIHTAKQDSATTSYDVDGIRVIHRSTPANDVVAANLYLLGGVRQVNANNAGVESLLLEASERGTHEFSKDRLRKIMAGLGSTIVVDADADWTVIGLRSTKQAFDSTWAVLASRVLHPEFRAGEVELVRSQVLAAVRQRRDDPDAHLGFLADSFAFAGHPYAVPPEGTERSIAALSVDDLRQYHTEQFVKSRMLLVVVGNVPRSRVEQLVRGTIATLPAGSYRWTLPDTLAARSAGIVFEQRSLPTNYILGYYAGPSAASRDYQALRVAAAVLSGQFFAEIRSRRNLTYAVDAPFIERALASGGLYVTTVSPDTTLSVMQEQMTALREGLIDADALERLIQQFITEYFLDNETNAEQATFLARAHLYRGDYRAAERFVDELRQVTPFDVQRVARRYMRNVKFAYVGDTRRLSMTVVRGF